MRHSWTISKERNRLEEQVSAGKLDPSKQFDFSEIYIFGKYENFVKRVSNINELLNTIQNFRSGWKYLILIGQLKWIIQKTVLSTNEKVRWKNVTLRELKQPIQTLTQLLNLSRENHMTFLIIARYYVIHMSSHAYRNNLWVIILKIRSWGPQVGGRSPDSPQNRGHIRESDDLKRSNYFSTSWYDHNLTQRKFRDHILTDAITLWLPNFSFLNKQNFFMVFNKILFG